MTQVEGGWSRTTRPWLGAHKYRKHVERVWTRLPRKARWRFCTNASPTYAPPPFFLTPISWFLQRPPSSLVAIHGLGLGHGARTGYPSSPTAKSLTVYSGPDGRLVSCPAAHRSCAAAARPVCLRWAFNFRLPGFAIPCPRARPNVHSRQPEGKGSPQDV